MIEPQIPDEFPSEMISHKRRLAWAREVIEEAERHGVPEEPLEKERSQSHTLLMWL